MTIVIPKPGIVDKLLRLLGKQRGVILQRETMDFPGAQVYFAPRKESALKAILRPNTEALPPGMADIFTFQDLTRLADVKVCAKTSMPFDWAGLPGRPGLNPPSNSVSLK
jgi:hypothetical protein